MTAPLDSAPATDTINVTPVNDAPVVTAGHTLNYTENQAATAFDPAITVSDVDSANLASRDGADHRQLRQRPGRARLHQPERHHRLVQCGDRHADPDRLVQRRELPDRAGLGDLRQHQRQSVGPDRTVTIITNVGHRGSAQFPPVSENPLMFDFI